MPSFIKIHEVQHVEKKRKVSARTLYDHYHETFKLRIFLVLLFFIICLKENKIDSITTNFYLKKKHI